LENANARKNGNAVLLLVQLAILVGIEVIIAFTSLGSIQIGPIPATLAHIPVILAAVVLGVGAGTFMGFVFGLLSCIWWTIYQYPTAFIFTPFAETGNFYSLIVCFVPRILLGLVCAILVRAFMKFDKKGYIAIPLAALLSTLMHTVFVMTGVYIFFGADSLSALFNDELSKGVTNFILVTVGTNGMLEAVIAIVFALAFAKALPALKKYMKK
jgi:uncharacterized membrane protein